MCSWQVVYYTSLYRTLFSPKPIRKDVRCQHELVCMIRCIRITQCQSENPKKKKIIIILLTIKTSFRLTSIISFHFCFSCSCWILFQTRDGNGAGQGVSEGWNLRLYSAWFCFTPFLPPPMTEKISLPHPHPHPLGAHPTP